MYVLLLYTDVCIMARVSIHPIPETGQSGTAENSRGLAMIAVILTCRLNYVLHVDETTNTFRKPRWYRHSDCSMACLSWRLVFRLIQRTGQSGTAESWGEQNALTSELCVSRWVDEHVDCTVGVCKPHHGELYGGRWLERTHERLHHDHEHVRCPESEVSETGEREDLQCSTGTECGSSVSHWLATVQTDWIFWHILMLSGLASSTLQCRCDTQSCEDQNCSREYRDIEASDDTEQRILPV